MDANPLNLVSQWQAQGILPVMAVTANGFSLTGGGKILTISADTDLDGAPPGASAWGGITGTLSNQSDLQAALDAKGTSNFNGTYAALTGKPTLGTAAATDATAYATAAQGALAGTALQPNGSAASLTGFPTLNQNTSGSAASLSAALSFANGGTTGLAAAPATTGAMTVNMTSSVITITPTGACTFNGSGGVAGQLVTFAITTSGTASFVLTWGTNFRKTGTLATGTTSARFFTVTFRCLSGSIWTEVSRTAVQT